MLVPLQKVTTEEYAVQFKMSVQKAQNELRRLVAEGYATRASEPHNGRMRYVYTLLEKEELVKAGASDGR